MAQISVSNRYYFAKLDYVYNISKLSQISLTVSKFTNRVPIEFSIELLVQIIIFDSFTSQMYNCSTYFFYPFHS